ncbi:MAG: hypothetical protein A2937_01605 [Candidatus Yonathbacteria bacterium RIFCSPLOWO2_01_FULL_47_33b]|uniref:Dockerin domain-containing protein n=1 Tax=Candidatus Yonathbacteria bacterium RIFCSPLOWO2_01_FULL_47_33b TaxID=1802727 RepID=A0A1G2SH68_9BACT|nr:MAG: hypothetical protein A2937_01605 [Candidatus Yonathbacteria bacterium RIFCSPLOWO2_01_FULL_47_33b]
MKKIAIGFGVLTGFLAFTAVAFAQTYTPLAPLPIGEGGTTPDTYTLSSYLVGAIKLLVAAGGAIAVLMLIIRGTQYVAAGINPSAKSDAKERIMGALIGLTLVLTSYLILNSIDPRLVEFNLTLPPVGQSPAAAATPVAPTPSAPAPVLNNGGTNPSAQPVAPAAAAPVTITSPTTAVTPLQNIINARINRSNDYSVISNCMGNTTYDLCVKTDLNGDGQTNLSDIVLFTQKGNLFDVNQNRVIELANTTAAASCFFKMPGANVHAMLPRENWNQSWSDGGSSAWYISGYSCGGSGGITGMPTVACSGATWIKAPALMNKCAITNGYMNMPFGFVYGGGSQFSKFQNWVTSSSVGSAVDLRTLFKATFFRPIASGDGIPQDEYFETDDGKLTYATIAEYDLNNDGTADFNASGADMTAFSACQGGSASGACARADFNQDGTIDARDLNLVKLMRNDVFGGSGFTPLGWILNWFESAFFDPAGYSDTQIISYCIGHAAFERCGYADVNGDHKIDNADLTAFNTGAPLLDFNSDGKVDLR